ncbi:MAG: enoyl-CoA hydratase/isomerase family protein [Candidatus Zixiibacteriota bacterium]
MKLQTFDFSGEQFSASTEEHVAILEVSGDVKKLAQDFAVRETFFSLLEIFETDPSLHCLLIISDQDALGQVRYEEFWSQIFGPQEGIAAGQVTSQDRALLTAAREESALIQVCRAFSSSKKLIIVAADGSVVGPYFGAMLAADFRIATNRLVVEFPHIKMGMTPLGAIAYYLPRYVGPSLARDNLLFGAPLPATRAHELGLFDSIVAVDEYRESSLALARRAANIPRSVVRYTKELLQLEWDHFDEFVNWESNHIRLDKVFRSDLEA